MKRTIPISYDSVLGMIQTHARQDDVGFRKNAETIITYLSTSNRPGEASLLREFLSPLVATNGHIPQTRKGPNGTTATSTMNPAPIPIHSLSSDIKPLIASPPPRRVSSEDIILAPTTRRALEKILAEYTSKNRLEEAGLMPSTRLLFWGPPGCGKTLTAHWLANQLNLPFGIVRLSAVITSYVGETSANLQKIFRQANDTPMVLLLDEADAIAKNREDRNDVGELKRVVNSLLQAMDELQPGKTIIIFASNHQYLFDTAIWRRFDDVIEFPLPGKEQRLEYLRRFTSGLRITGTLPTLAQNTTTASFADLARICQEASKTAILSGTNQTTTAILTDIWRDWKNKQNSAQSRTRKSAPSTTKRATRK
ncbi:AAA family ATPase [Geminisphaera colitermitum]|uniref:AAA family ATPase n=1 Tax=Geminisphaera colitermitum TaxID=1148786 RepID=UPI000158CC04|nr:ATP-binding protein [Geminisphaera colitermitum]